MTENRCVICGAIVPEGTQDALFVRKRWRRKTMIEYKRLTTKGKITKENTVLIRNEYNDIIMHQDAYDMLANAFNQLAELEDKIENGTLIELPCKVGDTVYYETFTRNGKQNMGIQGHEVLGVRVLVMAKNNYGDMWTEIPLSCFGKDTFLTKAEAEQRLKELKGEV